MTSVSRAVDSEDRSHRATAALPHHLSSLLTSIVVPRWLIQPTSDLLRPYTALLPNIRSTAAHPTTTALTPSTAAPTHVAGRTSSLWSVIAPFDRHCQFAATHIWTLLSDLDAIRATCVNKATLRSFNQLTIRTSFSLLKDSSAMHLAAAAASCPNRHQHCPIYPFANVLCQPNPKRLEGGLLKQLWPLLPRLSHLVHLDITMTGSADIGDELQQLPATVTCFHLSIPSLLCRRLRPGALPPTLRTLTVYRGYNQSSAFPPRVLPSQLEELRIEDTGWNFPLHGVFAPDSELRVFDVQGNYNQSLAPLPATLTEIDLSGSRWNFDLSALAFPLLRTLKLGGSGPFGYDKPITSRSLAGLPLLSTLDLLSVVHGAHEIEPGVLALSTHLTHLSLPALYSHPLTSNVLPPTLKHLVIGSSDLKLRVGCLPDGLLTLRMASAVTRAQFNRPLPAGVIPSTLTELYIDSDEFDRSLHATLPADSRLAMFSMFSPHFTRPLPSFVHLAHLRTLALCIAWPNPLPARCLPPTLTTFNVGGGYVHALQADTVAYVSALDTLDLDSSTPQGFSEQLFHARLEAGQLPAQLKRLHLPYDYPHSVEQMALPLGCVVSIGRCDIWRG